MKGQKLAVVLMLLALQWVPAADASTQPFDENTVVINPAAGGDDPFSIKTDIPAIVKEAEAIDEEIKKLFDDAKDTDEEKKETGKKIVKHTVKAGDSLWAIAQRLLGDGSRYREIIEANKDKYPSLEKNPDLILTGWELEIPQEGAAAAPETDDNTNSVTDSDNDNKPLSSDRTGKIDNQAKAAEEPKKDNKKADEAKKAADAKKAEAARKAEEPKKATDSKKAEEAKKAENAKKAEEARKLEEAKKAEEARKAKAAEEARKIEKEAQKAANSRYFKMLSAIGMPDVSDNKDYYKAVDAGSKLLSKGFFGGTTAFYKFIDTLDYPYYNIRDMQSELKTLQQKYEKLVRENKTDRFLGIFGDTIESTGKQIAQVREKLAKAWAEMKKALDESKAKSDEMTQKMNEEKARISALQKELDGMDIYDSSNSSVVQTKMEEIKESKEIIEEAREKLGYYDQLKKVFK